MNHPFDFPETESAIVLATAICIWSKIVHKGPGWKYFKCTFVFKLSERETFALRRLILPLYLKYLSCVET